MCICRASIDDTSYLGTLRADAVTRTTPIPNNLGSVDWTFTLDNDAGAAAGGGSDHHPGLHRHHRRPAPGGTVTQDVTVTITGTNDAPTITAATTAA